MPAEPLPHDVFADLVDLDRIAFER